MHYGPLPLCEPETYRLAIVTLWCLADDAMMLYGACFDDAIDGALMMLMLIYFDDANNRMGRPVPIQ